MSQRITRLAPSPTGALHLGNARTFLVNWLLAKQNGWAVRLRMEDLDTPRTKAGADRQALRELHWLGLDWSGDIVYQTDRSADYDKALDELIDTGWAYPCVCTRGDIVAAQSAPADEDRQPAYPGTCRGRFESFDEAEATGRPVAWRVRAPEAPVRFTDRFAGPQEFDLADCSGDFVIVRKAGQAAYQLAVTIDDDAIGVDAIVRGHDLLESAAMQIHLRSLLGLSQEVDYWHIPLIVGPDGRKLAKRHGDTRLDSYIAGGTPVERVLGLLGWWSGCLERRQEADLATLLDRFDIARIPTHEVIFHPDDDAFLRGR